MDNDNHSGEENKEQQSQDEVEEKVETQEKHEKKEKKGGHHHQQQQPQLPEKIHVSGENYSLDAGTFLRCHCTMKGVYSWVLQC